MSWWLLALVPAAFTIGMLPSAVMVARSHGVDIRAEGSGNPGASNVSRVLGWKAGVAVFVLDAAKGAIASGAAWIVVGRWAGYLCGGVAALGHMFPIAANSDGKRFQGGKGVATVGGAMLVMQPIVSPALIVVWVAVSRVTKRASLGSIAIIVLLPVGEAVLGSPGWEIAASAALGLLVLARHTDNIRRLMRRQELSLDKGA